MFLFIGDFMKNYFILKFFFLAVVASLMLSINVQAKESKEVKLQTTAKCADCKVKIEKGLKKVKGVETATLNLDDKIVTVKYDPTKTDETKIKGKLADLGYSPDSPADKQHKCSDSKAGCKDSKAGCKDSKAGCKEAKKCGENK
jgi:periplasmic mercuric ion binding protein